MKKNRIKVSIWGIFPPPIGGLAIHIQREAELLKDEGVLDKVYYFHCDKRLKSEHRFRDFVVPMKNPLRYTILEYGLGLITFMLKNKAAIVHFHNSLDGAWMILFMNLILRKEIVITVHDQMRIPSLPKSFDLTYIFVDSLFRNRKIRWIAVNPAIKDQLMAKGVDSRNIAVIPAYLKSTERTDLPRDLTEFCIRQSPVLSVYAFATNLFKGEDLYGVDLALSLLSRLKTHYVSVGLVVVIPGRKDQSMIDKYKKFVANNSLEDHVFFQFDIIDDCASLWSMSDIYLRPTNTDGDSVAVREALDVSCVSLASDCVARPAGCVLFKDRNIDDLYQKAVMVLEQKEAFVKAIPGSNDFYSKLHQVLFNYAE